LSSKLTADLGAGWGPALPVLRFARMPIDHILALLIAERDKLNRAIEALQGPTKRRGRPPKNPFDAATPTEVAKPARKKRRKFSTAQREAAAERMRQRWAAKKKAALKATKKA
jgi:hypothetical protein